MDRKLSEGRSPLGSFSCPVGSAGALAASLLASACDSHQSLTARWKSCVEKKRLEETDSAFSFSAPDSTDLSYSPILPLAANLLEIVVSISPLSCCSPCNSPALYNLVFGPHHLTEAALDQFPEEYRTVRAKRSLGIFVIAVSGACADHRLALEALPRDCCGTCCSSPSVFHSSFLIFYDPLDIPWLFSLHVSSWTESPTPTAPEPLRCTPPTSFQPQSHRV